MILTTNGHATGNGFITDVISWDIGNWSTALDYWTRYFPNGFENTLSLEIGAGRNGGLSLWLAQQGGNVICSSHAQPYPQTVETHERYGLQEKIRYETIDALNIPYENHFDFVVFKSVLGGISAFQQKEKARQCIAQMHKALKPGGAILFAENLAGTALHMFFRNRFTSGKKDGWTYWQKKELTTQFAEFSHFEYMTTGFAGCFGRTEAQKRFLTVWDKSIFNHIMPSAWRYIFIGIAQK